MINLTPFYPILIAWFVTHFEPWLKLYDIVFGFLPKWMKPLQDNLQCFKCASFWITLSITHNFILSILFSVIAYTYTKWINNMKTYL